MKKSLYSYFFEIDDEYVGYSYLSDGYVHFPICQKERVENILKFPDDIITNTDAIVYEELCDKKIILGVDFNEYNYLMRLHQRFIHQNNSMTLVIVPTFACNCRCFYCYELHTNAKMNLEVIDTLKKYIRDKIEELSHLNILWFGGEPLICMDVIKEVSEFCIDLCDKENVILYSNITTNGTLLNNKNAKILSDCKIFSAHITLDGPVKNHDQTRVFLGGGATFNIIRTNIISYLNMHEKNKVLLRIHVSDKTEMKDIKEIVETLELFDKKYRNRITAYPHVIFSACSETWSEECIESCKRHTEKAGEDEVDKITHKISEEVAYLGFGYASSTERRTMTTCFLEAKNAWVVRPDGYLTKCTVGIEKERALAKLTKQGIRIFNERYFKSENKEYSIELHDYCKECKYLPYCWHKCSYYHYQNPNGKKLSCKNIETWGIRRQMDRIMNRYIEEKVN